jgi:hypothetical protein
MGAKCHTEPNEEWVSKINRNPDGGFTVDTEDSAGNFDGTHSSQNIHGRCSGVTIYYWRPKNNPRYYYTGRFYSGGSSIRGTRQLLVKASRSTKKPIRPLTDDEWTAEKVTLVASKKSRKR